MLHVLSVKKPMKDPSHRILDINDVANELVVFVVIFESRLNFMTLIRTIHRFSSQMLVISRLSPFHRYIFFEFRNYELYVQ